MKQYWVEGIIITRQGVKKLQKSGRLSPTDQEIFSKPYWAETPEEAVRMATEELKGGQWKDKPRVNLTSEAQRMRTLGAPELPGLFDSPAKGKKKPR